MVPETGVPKNPILICNSRVMAVRELAIWSTLREMSKVVQISRKKDEQMNKENNHYGAKLHI